VVPFLDDPREHHDGIAMIRSDVLDDEQSKLMEYTTEVVASFVAGNKVAAADLAGLIATVHAALAGAGAAPAAAAEPETAKPTSAQIRRSIRPDGLVSFEDGKTYQTLKRHLTKRGMSLSGYKEKWGLPADYPTTAPNYSAKRSEMAKALGLGSGGRPKAPPAPPPPVKAKRTPRKKADAS
jgi:predicted transcriptional regulator